MSITLDEVRHVARLARLELDEAELLAFQGELNSLLGRCQELQSIDVGELSPRTHAVALTNVLADDTPTQGLDQSLALRGAAVTRAGLFVVPTIIEE
ncbi:MAG: Asp-tRNA(Asn)/Glu-tRNA(Gln) amidotransferase subunit GatC [Fimbriimonadaceae bacterium]|nr:Asp-tRNA(Asn)/Glu-tRNA(Gln) amidotransferase subunit GatC [Fimbriimonadaceae bacterium]QYK57947.1 MAG: Asp-tRNA(Asn)/Glu-tRNA(Gln) amidotransferase subunit GatC [Fimbriimonadaceae bacterium]